MLYKDFLPLVGVPYKDMNCWDIVVKFYLLILGVELKHYWDESVVPEDKKQIQTLITSNMGDFEEVASPQFGDIVVVKILGIENHLGVYVGQDLFLHTQERTGSVIDRVSKWQRMIVGYFRLKEAKIK